MGQLSNLGQASFRNYNFPKHNAAMNKLHVGHKFSETTYVRNEEQPFNIHFRNDSYEKGYRTWFKMLREIQYPVNFLISLLIFLTAKALTNASIIVFATASGCNLYYMTSLDLEEYRI